MMEAEKTIETGVPAPVEQAVPPPAQEDGDEEVPQSPPPPSASASPPPPTGWFDLKMKIFTLVIVLFLVVAIAIGAAIIKSNNSNNNSSSSATNAQEGTDNGGKEKVPTPSPTAMTVAPTSSALPPVLNYLKTLSVTEEGVLEDITSPQYRAALWLVDEDKFSGSQGGAVSIDQDPKIFQRYSLAVFYFATNGDKWKKCGRNSLRGCDDTVWLTNTDECHWYSVSCNEDDGIVDALTFSFSGNDLIGTMPAELSLFTGMKRFFAGGNVLKGDLDTVLAGLTSLEILGLPNNQLSGTIPVGIFNKNPRLGVIGLHDNQLTGPIPTEIGAASNLHDVQLFSNALTGTIPAELGNLTKLSILEIQENQLNGPIPEPLYNLTRLQRLSLEENAGISGTISPLISQLTRLNILQLGFTSMGGTLPSPLFDLLELTELNLENAGFSGTIPELIRQMNYSLMDLLLNDNQFTGRVPEAFDHLTALEALMIQGNQLTGTISPAICAERGLRFQQLEFLEVDCVVTCTCCDDCRD